MPDLYSFKLPDEREQFSKAFLGIFVRIREINSNTTQDEYDRRFDDFILAHAAQIGSRILYCDDVIDAIHRWTSDPLNGAKKWKQLTSAFQALMDKRTRSVLELSGPAAEVMSIWPEEASKGLGELWRLLRQTKAAKKEWDHKLHLANAKRAIEQMPVAQFRYVKINGSSLLLYLESNEGNFTRWVEGNLTHIALAYIWGAAANGYGSAESFRQAIVALRRKIRAQKRQTQPRPLKKLRVI